MATKLSTIFLNHASWPPNNKPHFFTPLPRFLRTTTPLITTCKMRQRNLSSQPKRHQAKKVSPEPLPQNKISGSNSDDNADVDNDTVNLISSSYQMTPSETFQPQGEETTDVKTDTEIPIDGSMQSADESIKDKMSTVETTDDADFGGSDISETETAHSGEHDQPKDLIEMLTNSEKNILLLEEARIKGLNDLRTVIAEKEALQKEITTLEMRLAESDAQIDDAAQEKLRVELLESQLEKLKRELSEKDDIDDENKIRFHSLSKELSLLRTSNNTLKDDIRVLKEELDTVKETDKQILELEDERASLKDGVKNLESKLAVAQDDVAKLSPLKQECRDLWAKVENLQDLLDRASKQADEAVSVLQQNSELQKKVDSLEKSLEEAQMYRLSSEKMQQNNELMQQKIRLLEERLESSDQEILSHVQLYEESLKEFQDSLDNLKEESKKKSLAKPVSDMSWEFWSRLLLMIDGWFLEKKISSNDAKLLKEMVLKKDAQICDAYLTCTPKNESEILSSFLRLISSSPSGGMHVVHIAAEMAPVAKVGGLGDVVSGLGKALQKKGHYVEIIIPKYDCMQFDRVSDLRALDVVVESYFDGRLFKNKIWVGIVEGLPVYFIEPQHPANFFLRGQFYGEHDDFKRFSYFSRAALELLLQSGKTPDIIHCHDWQTAFVAPLYWDIYVHRGLNLARICFTCHNFEYQGTAHPSELTSCGLDVSQLNRPDRMQDNSTQDRVNPLKGAIVFSNIVTTVSPTYAQEVRTAERGHGLHNTLNSHSKKFVGVLNGIDTEAWDPSTDVFLKVKFNADNLRGKMENKKDLRKLLNLSMADSTQPLVGCITRLVPQKGVHLIRHAIYRTMELGGQFVLLGSSPVEHIQREFEGIAEHFQNHPHIRLILKYDEALSHSIYAASDMFIIPSIFEPCGLTQMIAMRYGGVPIVRKTGGLNDSVFDVDDGSTPLQFRNGFTFLTPDEQGVSRVLERAFHHYNNNRDGWQQLVQKNMKIDFSWDSSASQYIELYENATARAKAAAKRA